MSKLVLEQGRHFGKYIQSGENLEITPIAGEEGYSFQVVGYEAFTINPETDLSHVTYDILKEFDTQMSYCGESDDNEIRGAKFSTTRHHIQSYLYA